MAAFLLLAMFAQAKNHTIYVRGKGVSDKSKTEVSSLGADTLQVSPGQDVREFVVSIKTMQGSILFQQVLVACYEDCYTFIAPDIPNGYYLEVRDDRGYIYKEIEN